MIRIGRKSAPGVELFGSKIENNTTIALTIKEGERDEEYGSERYWGGPIVVEVEMSQNQFAELITTPNVNDGVPCTIRRREGVSIPYPEGENPRVVSERYLQQTIMGIAKRLKGIQEMADKINGAKTVNKSDRAWLVKELGLLDQDLRSDMPFVKQVFEEEMDKVVAEAKADVDATITHAVHTLGIEALRDKKMLLENHNVEPGRDRGVKAITEDS